MALVASGSSTGGILHPIMLNNLFHSKVGFNNGVRASAGLIAGCLILAIALMRPKYPKTHPSGQGHPPPSELLSKFVKDKLYITAVFGYVCSRSVIYEHLTFGVEWRWVCLVLSCPFSTFNSTPSCTASTPNSRSTS